MKRCKKCGSKRLRKRRPESRYVTCRDCHYKVKI